MNTETLQRMDEQADRIIGRWSFAALCANILPPPFDMFAVGTVFASMGGHIARIYGVQMSRSVLRDLGVAIAKGMGGVLAAFYVGTGLLKYVPGVNVWVALLVQPPVVGAVAYAAGHAFKQYYHAVVIEGRGLTAAQVSALATQALREKLKFLSESGYQMHGGSRQLELKEPIEKRRYSERRVILLTDKFSVKDYFRLARQPSHLCFVSRDQTESVDWPVGHPVSDTLYIGHPLKPTIYYLATEFHNRLFEDKIVEFSKMLRHLGAKSIKIEHIEGYRHGGGIGAELHASGTVGLGAFNKDVNATGTYSSGGNRSVMYQTSYSGTNHSALPKDMVWFSHEPLWKELAEARQEHRMQRFDINFAYTNDFGVNAKLRASIEESVEKLKLKLKLKSNLEGMFADFQNTIWHISGEFVDAA